MPLLNETEIQSRSGRVIRELLRRECSNAHRLCAVERSPDPMRDAVLTARARGAVELATFLLDRLFGEGDTISETDGEAALPPTQDLYETD